jgi:GT2 family glycosyltransferase
MKPFETVQQNSEKIAVIIPHLNQPDYLRKCLASLSLQTVGMGRFEVFVVDNGSRELPTDVVSCFQNVTLTTEARPGPGPARNKAVAISTGTILAFIDADCIADADWLACVSEALSIDKGRSVVGGAVRIATLIPGKPNMVEAYEQVFSFRQKFYIEVQNYSATLNMATRRDVFERVGPFGGIEIAEDRDWGQRALKMGLKTHFIPGMVVTHPARANIGEICGKWDRLLSHDYEEYRSSFGGRLKWFLKSLAVAVSPVVSGINILKSKQVQSWRDRCLAACGLVFVRLYRTRKMFSLLFGSRKGAEGHSWNRG